MKMNTQMHQKLIKYYKIVKEFVEDIKSTYLVNMNKHFLRKMLFVFILCLVILFPFITLNINFEPLNGVEYKVKLADFNLKNLSDNSYQNSLDDYIDQNLNSKPLIVRLRNQLLYDVFNISPNYAVALNDDKQLISKEVLNYYLHGQYYMTDAEVKNKAAQFIKFDKILKQHNKKMLILITPAKARYLDYKDYPEADKILMSTYKYKKPVAYDRFIKELKKENVLLFDSIDFIEKNKNEYLEDAAPLFNDTGHHWSYYKGRNIGVEVIDFVTENTDITWPKLKILASRSEVATYPDDDLLRLLNLNKNPKYTYMNTAVQYVDTNSSFPSVVISGGSFLGELLFPFATYGLDFNKVYHIENKLYYMNHYDDKYEFEKYDEIPIKKDLKDIDLFIFEINEVNIYNASFGFIDYLLDNLEYLE